MKVGDLKKIAAAVKAEIWTTENFSENMVQSMLNRHRIAACFESMADEDGTAKRNAEFIATFHPVRMIAILDKLDDDLEI